MMLLGCEDGSKDNRILAIRVHANADGTTRVSFHGERIDSASTKFTINHQNSDGADGTKFRIQNDHYTVAGSCPSRWAEGEEHAIQIDHTQSEGTARYLFEITADSGIEVSRHAKNTEEFWVGQAFTLTKAEQADAATP